MIARRGPHRWPNLLTGARLAAALALPAPSLLLAPGAAAGVGFALFAAAALTDAADGWMARRLNSCSALGAWLDPLADKALTLSALAVLGATAARADAWFAAPAGVIAARELLVGAARLRPGPATPGAAPWPPPPSRLSKIKTAVLMTALGALFAAETAAHAVAAAAAPVWLWSAGLGLLWLAALLAAWSAVAYACAARASNRSGERSRQKRRFITTAATPSPAARPNQTPTPPHPASKPSK